MWNFNMKIDCIFKHDQFFHLEISDDVHDPLGVVAVYANPHDQTHHILWPLIGNICHNYS